MKATDERHGIRAGYIAGCRDDCCSLPHRRYQKASSLRRLREGSQYIAGTNLLDRHLHWARYGITAQALSRAAGLSPDTIREAFRSGRQVERITERAVLTVRWSDFDDAALVYADLARRRIGSLQAAGHSLTWICSETGLVYNGGKWREQEKMRLGFARAVADLYHRAPIAGTNRQAATKARQAGHRPPAAWDDPGTPAAPKGWTPEVADLYAARHLTPAEELIAEWDHLRSLGVSEHHAARQLGVEVKAVERALQRRAKEACRAA